MGTSLADVEARYRAEDMVKAAQEAINHRPNFAVDAIGDSDGEEEEGGAGDGGDVMDEVCLYCFECCLRQMQAPEEGYQG